MSATVDHAVLDPAQSRLRLRSDLRATPRSQGDRTVWVLEDPLRGRYFEIGAAEYVLLSQLDGQRTIAEAVASAASQVTTDSLNELEAIVVCRWLVQHDLAQPVEGRGPSESSAKRAPSQPRSSFNPLSICVWTCDPDRLLERLNTVLGGLWSPWGGVLWLGVATAATAKLGQHTSAWQSMPGTIFDPSNWLRLIVAWTLLKLLHELGHGLACKRFRAPVSRAGVLLLMFAPVAFVDVTAAWRLPQRWQRIVISAAGMIVELLVAGVAILLWQPGSTELFDRLCLDVVLLAGVHTLLFNLNPLMRFDGYYMLADAVGISNLYAEGQRQVDAWRRHWFGGVEVAAAVESHCRAAALLSYGLLAIGWRCLVFLSLSLGLIARWDWAGIMPVAIVAWFWFGRAGKNASASNNKLRTSRARRRQCVSCAGCAMVLGVGLVWLVSPAHVVAPAIVEYDALAVVRADATGFVISVPIATGESVEPGQILVEIANDELQAELKGVEIKLQQAELRSRSLRHQQEHSKQQAESALIESLATKRDDLLKQQRGLTIRATRSGVIATRQVAALVGKYVKQGDVLLTIGDEAAKELIVSVATGDQREFVGRCGAAVHVYHPGDCESRLIGTLAQLEPRARDELPHDALGSHNGGEVIVKLTNDTPGSRQTTTRSLEPRLIARVTLDESVSRRLWAGQRVTVGLHAQQQSWGRRMFNAARSYLQALSREQGGKPV